MHDESPESPREWDNFGRLVTWDRFSATYEETRPASGTRNASVRDVNGVGGRRLAHELMRGESCAVRVALPNGQHFREGFMYATREAVRREFNGDIDKARACLESEAETYIMWADGDVYGYVIERRTLCELCDALEPDDVPDECPHCDINDEDSCWGFYGLDARKWGADLDADALAALYAEADEYHVEYGPRERVSASWREAA